jgi:hypothetical protein
LCRVPFLTGKTSASGTLLLSPRQQTLTPGLRIHFNRKNLQKYRNKYTVTPAYRIQRIHVVLPIDRKKFLFTPLVCTSKVFPFSKVAHSLPVCRFCHRQQYGERRPPPPLRSVVSLIEIRSPVNKS